MVQQPMQGERVSRSPLPGRSCVRSSALHRMTRYGLRGLVLAGVAGTAWLLGSHVAAAAPPRTVPATVIDTLARLDGAAVGTETCDRPCAGSHGGTARPHTTPDDSPGRTAREAARGAEAVPSHGAAHSSVGTDLMPVRPLTAPVESLRRTLGAGEPGVVLSGRTATTAHPVPGPLTSATRPVSGVPGATGPLLPGVSGRAATSSTGVPVSGSGPSTEQPRRVDTVHRTAVRTSATWTDGSTARPANPVPAAELPAPGRPGPTPLPASPGPGMSSGGSAASSAAHTDGGVCAAAEPPTAVRTGSASRVRPATAALGTPRRGEADPVVSPD